MNATGEQFVTCPSCDAPFRAREVTARGEHTCELCHTSMRVALFPALQRRMDAVSGDRVSGVAVEAVCFFHPDRKAERYCEHCGRLVCSLCDLDVGRAHLCPSCAASRRTSGEDTALQTEAVRYDRIAIALTVYPLVIIPLFYFIILTAPAAIVMAIRGLSKQKTVIPRPRYRFVLAILLGVAELVGWVALASFIISAIGKA